MLLRDRGGFLVSLCRCKLRNWPFFEALAGKLTCIEVMLLSGKCCSQLFDLDDETLEDMLRECATLLNVDENQVLGTATLMHGTAVVSDLREDLEAGKMHELTLVMS